MPEETQQSLFRESAMERLSSPEQLDRCLRVTSPKGWIALSAMWVLLATIVTWSIFGEVPTKEDGRGILVAGGGLGQIVATGAGRLSDILVNVDDQVAQGQVIARIDQQDLADQLNETQSRLRELRHQHDALSEFDEREEELQATLAEVEMKRLGQIVDFSNDRLERLRSRRSVVQQLIADGMMSDIDLERVDEEMETALVAIEKARLEMEQLTARNRNATFQRERERLNRMLQIDEIERRVAMLEARLERESLVKSPVAGRVVEIRAAMHSAVTIGSPILLIEQALRSSEFQVPSDEYLGSSLGRGRGPQSQSMAIGDPPPLEAVLYVSATTGKRILRGMMVDISPSTVRREEYGSMRGVVSFVADVPTSRSAMMAVLNDADMVEQFTRRIGLPLEVRVQLLRNDETPSGYEWTSSTGPPSRVSAGTLCSGSVTIRRQRPISLVIPMFKRVLDADAS